MPNFLNHQHATQTFPKYPFSSQNNTIKQTTSTLNHPPNRGYIPPAERMRLAALAEEINNPNPQNFNQKDFPKLQTEEDERHIPSQNCSNNTTSTKDVQGKSDSPHERVHASEMTENSTTANKVTEQNKEVAANNSSDPSNSSGPNVSSATAPTPECIQNPNGNDQTGFNTNCYRSALGVQSLPEIQRILKMKIIPPFRKEHFENAAVLEREISRAYSEILLPFQPRHRPYITISRTFEKRNNKSLHTLLVTAPQEAEQDVENIKINGLQIMGRTVFPTGEDFYQIRTSQYPRKVWVRITNLPYLCNDVSLMEMLNLPDQIQPLGPLQRETINTEFGQIHSGKARIQVSVPDAESINRLREWSFLKNGLEITQWCDIPIYMSAPSLHHCTACEAEGRLHVGHDILWCRINRNKKEQNVTTPPQTTEDESTPIAIEVDNIARTLEDHNNNGTDQQQGQHETSAVIQSEAEVESDKEESELEEEQWVNNTSKNKNNSGIKRPNPPSDSSGTPRKTPNNKFQILGNSSGDETPNNKENKKQIDTQHTRVQKKKKQKTVDNGKNG